MSSVVVRCCTYIHPEHFDRHAVRCLPFMNWEWISFSSLRWVCRLDRMSSVYMSGSLGRDSLPSLLLLPAITFDPPPPSHLFRLGRWAEEACVCQRVSLSLKLWCLPTFCSTGRARRQAATVKCTIRRAWRHFFSFVFFTSISPPHCNIGRFLLQLPVWAFIQTTETVHFRDDLTVAEEVCFQLSPERGKLSLTSTCRIYRMTSLLANQGSI